MLVVALCTCESTATSCLSPRCPTLCVGLQFRRMLENELITDDSGNKQNESEHHLTSNEPWPFYVILNVQNLLHNNMYTYVYCKWSLYIYICIVVVTSHIILHSHICLIIGIYMYWYIFIISSLYYRYIYIYRYRNMHRRLHIIDIKWYKYSMCNIL